MKQFAKVLALLFLVTASAPVFAAETKVFFSPNGGCQQEIVTEIGKARKTIDVAMYAFTSREIAQALLKAKDRNVKIRITLDAAQIKDHYSKSRYLLNKGFTVKFHMGPGLMHSKFAVIDNNIVLTGSFNWTASAEKRNVENMLVIRDRSIAEKFSKQFKHLWSQSGEGESKELHAAAE